jgi:CRP-like cAMP-binding protein
MSRPTSGPAEKNRLLQALPRQHRERLLAHGEHVDLTFADVLFEAEQRMRYVFFPTGGFISLITRVGARATLEVARIGDEGMLGLRFLLGSKVAPLRALVQGSGAAWRIRAAPFCRELERSLPLRQMLNRYLDVRLHQLAQTALCAHFHAVDARLARSLLMTGDQAHSDQFYITQAFISSMLGVRREGVNHAAFLLQERKLIRYSRGRLTILDRRGLRAAACGCYAVGRESYARILG